MRILTTSPQLGCPQIQFHFNQVLCLTPLLGSDSRPGPSPGASALTAVAVLGGSCPPRGRGSPRARTRAPVNQPAGARGPALGIGRLALPWRDQGIWTSGLEWLLTPGPSGWLALVSFICVFTWQVRSDHLLHAGPPRCWADSGGKGLTVSLLGQGPGKEAGVGHMTTQIRVAGGDPKNAQKKDRVLLVDPQVGRQLSLG